MELNLTGFETAIKKFLDNMASEDMAFAENYRKPNKSISECCKYIMQEVEKNRKGQRCVACTDEEVFGLAIHYYDEDDIVVNGPKTNVEAVSTSQSAPETTVKPTASTETEAPKPKRTRKKAAPVDPDIPDSLEIPLF